MKKFLTLLLLEAVLLQPLWAADTAPVSGKPTQPLSLFRKKNPHVKSGPISSFIGYSEISSAIRPGNADSAELGRFLQETCGTVKSKELSGTDKILGTLGTLASGAYAGVAAAQWFDSQNSKGQKVNGDKVSGTNPSAKTI